MSDELTPIVGGCLCGAVRFEITETPLWTVHCHCQSCRRFTGSAFTTFVGVRASGIDWLSARPKTYVTAEGVERQFCDACGASLTFRSPHLTGDVGVHAGALDAPGRLTPERHVNCDEVLPWIDLGDELPRKTGAQAI